tara:strand:+ start:131 stop:526 length:396 start_codon:yes stop_codon:yes gene_type:complete
MNKYQNSKIYKIHCNITNEDYYGSTYDTLEERLRKHKCFKDCISKNILDRDDYEIILIKNYPCSSKKELLWEERRHLENNICINTIKRPIITEEEDKQRRHIYRTTRINCPICNLEVSKMSLTRHLKRKHT